MMKLSKIKIEGELTVRNRLSVETESGFVQVRSVEAAALPNNKTVQLDIDCGDYHHHRVFEVKDGEFISRNELTRVQIKLFIDDYTSGKIKDLPTYPSIPMHTTRGSSACTPSVQGEHVYISGHYYVAVLSTVDNRLYWVPYLYI